MTTTLYCWCKARAYSESLESNPLCEKHFEAEELEKDMRFLRELRLESEQREARMEELEGLARSMENS